MRPLQSVGAFACAFVLMVMLLGLGMSVGPSTPSLQHPNLHQQIRQEGKDPLPGGEPFMEPSLAELAQPAGADADADAGAVAGGASPIRSAVTVAWSNVVRLGTELQAHGDRHWVPPPLINATNDVLVLYWARDDFRVKKITYLYDLLRSSGFAVRLEIVEPGGGDCAAWADHPLGPGERAIVASRFEHVKAKAACVAKANIDQFGVYIFDDEYGRFDQTSIPWHVSFILRNYYFTNQVDGQLRPPSMYLPTGYLTGRGPWHPQLLLPSSKRDIGCWFSGSMRADRDTIVTAFSDGSCKIEVTKDFALGLAADEYSFRMQRVKLALCPGGNNVETIRLYESFESGAIPVMTETEVATSHLLETHPGIPILRVPDWKDAAPFVRAWLEPESADDLDALQRYAIAWNQKFKHELGLALGRAIRALIPAL